MAQLKDSVVSGNLRVTGSTLTDTLQTTIIKAPTSANGTTYGPGQEGQVLKSSGTSVYWGSDNNVNWYHTTGTWNGFTYTAAKVGSPGDLAFTLPTGTGSNQVALGNHTHTTLNVGNVGSSTNPVYFSSGAPTACGVHASGSYTSFVPCVSAAGVMEIGPYIDFHSTTSTNDYDLRLEETSTNMLSLKNTSPTFRIHSTSHTNAALELWRDTDDYTDYRIINAAGQFKIQSDISEQSVHVDWFDMLHLEAKTGKATFKGTINAPGGTMSGSLIMSGGIISLNGYDIHLKTSGSSSDDSSDLIWYYGNGKEKMRIWSDNTYTAKKGPNFRVYKSDETLLFNGTLSLSDHTHSLSIAADSGTNALTLAANTKYKLTAGGSTFIFTTPASADKLTTARTISLGTDLQGSASFDGSGNITIGATNYQCSVNGGNKANYPWHRIAYVSGITGTYVDKDAVFAIRSGYNTGPFGIIKVSLRTNASGAAVNIAARWMVRYGFEENDVVIASWGTTGQSVYGDIFVKCSTYPRRKVYQMFGDRSWTLVSSNEVDNTTTSDKLTSKEVYASVASAGTEIHSQAYTSTVNANDASVVNISKTISTTTASNNADRVVFFADDSNTQKVVYNNNFKYNPSTNILTVGTVSGNATKTGIRWKAVTQGLKWSRIFWAAGTDGNDSTLIGTSGILSINCIRSYVVIHATFLITTSLAGSNYGNCIQLSGGNYKSGKVRLVTRNTDGGYYFEIYDNAESIASGTTQTWNCCFIPIANANVTTYDYFYDGTTVPSGYTALDEQTTSLGNEAIAIKNITRSGTTFTATRQNGSTFTFTQRDNDRYVNSAAFADDSTNTAASPVKMTLTRAGSDTATVTANIPKVSSTSAGVAPKGAAVSTQSRSTKFLREDGSWAAPSYTTVSASSNNGKVSVNGSDVTVYTHPSKTAQSTSNFYKITVDSTGHVTTGDALSASNLPSHTHLYAGSSSAGGAANSANILNKNATAGATTDGIQYVSQAVTVGSADGNAKEGSNASYKLWSYPEGGTAVSNGVANIQNLRLYWNTSFFRDLFISPNNLRIYHRSVYNGTAKPWRILMDTDNSNPGIKERCYTSTAGAGWFRLMTIDMDNQSSGSGGDSALDVYLTINRSWNSPGPPEVVKLHITFTGSTVSHEIVNSRQSNDTDAFHIFTKYRINKDASSGTKFYIDICHSALEPNRDNAFTVRYEVQRAHISPHSKDYFPDSWIASDETALTNTSTEGVTVVGEVEIPGWIFQATYQYDSSTYYGMAAPQGLDNVWIRTTSQGIMPYESGNSTSGGHSSLGTDSWYFSNAYINRVYGNTADFEAFQARHSNEFNIKQLTNNYSYIWFNYRLITNDVQGYTITPSIPLTHYWFGCGAARTALAKVVTSGMVVYPGAANASNYSTIIQSTTLTGNRTVNLPDGSGALGIANILYNTPANSSTTGVVVSALLSEYNYFTIIIGQVGSNAQKTTSAIVPSVAGTHYFTISTVEALGSGGGMIYPAGVSIVQNTSNTTFTLGVNKGISIPSSGSTVSTTSAISAYIKMIIGHKS